MVEVYRTVVRVRKTSIGVRCTLQRHGHQRKEARNKLNKVLVVCEVLKKDKMIQHVRGSVKSHQYRAEGHKEKATVVRVHEEERGTCQEGCQMHRFQEKDTKKQRKPGGRTRLKKVKVVFI